MFLSRKILSNSTIIMKNYNASGYSFLKSKHKIHTSAAFSSSPENPASSEISIENDKLLKDLQTITVPSKLLLMLEMYKNELSEAHIVGAMKSLACLCRQNKCEDSFKTKLVTQLLDHIEKNVEKFTLQQTLNILDMFVLLSVQLSANLFNVILKKLSSNVDNLSMRDCVHLATLLDKLGFKSGASRELSKVMNEKFVKWVMDGQGEEDIQCLSEAFKYCFFNIQDKKINEIIFRTLKIAMHKLSAQQATDILCTICTLVDNKYDFQEIFTALKDTIIRDINDLSITQLSYLTMKISHASLKNDTYYDSKLFDIISQRIILEDAGFDYGLSLLKSFNKMRYVNKAILNYLSAKYYEMTYISKKVMKQDVQKMTTLITGLAYAAYKPVFWNEIVKCISKPTILNFDHLTLCILAWHLSVLNYFDYKVLQKIFSSQYSYSYNNFMLWAFSRLHQKIHTWPNYKGPLPTNKHIEDLKALNVVRSDFPLQKTVENCYGNTNFVASDLWSNLYHRFDHVIIFGPNASPVQIVYKEEAQNISPQFIEDIIIPDHCLKVIITSTEECWYARNTDHLLGTYADSIQTLKKLYPVALINIRKWKKISDEEKKDLIREQVEKAIDTFKLIKRKPLQKQ